MSVPPIFPFLGGTLPPLIKERFRPELVSDPPPAMDVAGGRPLSPERLEEARRIFEVGRPVGIGMLQAGRIGPLNRLGQFINQELAEENQGEVQEFIGEVGDMANQRFGVDLGSVGQRPMFRPEIMRSVGTPIQGYKDGGAAFPDVTGPGGGPPDGKVTQADVLKLRGVELKEYGGPIGMQMGGDPMMAAGMPPPQAPPMPMPAPEQPPMPMEDQLDPNVVQQALAQAAGGIGDLDEAQNYEQVMNTMRGDQATVEERRQELAEVVGPGDANQTPESVLTLVQPVMMLANVDQGIGELAQQEMTQPMEGPMAEGIMSTVPEPPMTEAGGDAPVNFNKGGEVRPVQNFAPENTNRVAGTTPFASLRGQPISPFVEQAMAVRQPLLSDPASLQRQKDLTQAQILFDLAQLGLAFAAPMEGERPGLSPAERLAMAARSTRLPEKIAARAQALGDKEAAQEAQDKAIMASAITSAETRLAAKEKADRDAAAATAKAIAEAKESEKERAFELSKLELKTNLEFNKDKRLQENKYSLIASNDEKKAAATTELEKLKASNAINKEERIAELKKDLEGFKFENKKAEIEILNDDRKALLTTEFQLREALEKNKINLQMEANITEKTKLKNVDFELEKQLIDIRAEIKLNELEFSSDLSIKANKEAHILNLERDKVNNALKEELAKLDLAIKEKDLARKTAEGEAKTRIDEELLKIKQEKLVLEKAAAKALNVPGIEGAYVGWLDSNLDLAKDYAEGTTDAGQDNTIELVISNFTAPRSEWSEEKGKFVQKAGGKLSPAWENAIKAREEKFGASRSLPSTARKEAKVKLPELKFKADGTVDYEAFKGGNNFIINGVDLSKSTGLRSGLDRGLNVFFGQIKDVFGVGSGYSGVRGKEVSMATEQLNRLATSVISSSRNLVNGKVFALDLQLLQQDVDKFRPGAGNTDVRARDSLIATRNKVALGYNNLISKLNNPDSYTESQVTLARENKEKVEALLGELTAAIASFETGIKGSDVEEAETQTFQQSPTDNQPTYLAPRR
jgi:hypothetical protein